MSEDYSKWTLTPAVDVTGWKLVPSEKTDWSGARLAALDAMDQRLAASVPEAPPIVDPGGVGAIGHGLQQGLSFGAVPKVEAATSAALEGLGNVIGAQPAPGDFSERYQRHLAENRAEGETLQQAHPKTHLAADLVGGLPGFSMAQNPILSAAIGGGLRSAGESENVLGEKGTNLRGAAETAGGAATGAATAWLLPKVFGRLARGRGAAADEASKDLVTFGTQTARNKLENAMAPVAAMSPGGELAPGETATILRDIGAVRPTQRGVLKGIQGAKSELGDQFGSLIASADKAGPGVPLASIEPHLTDAALQNQANDHMEKVIGNINDRLAKLGGAERTGVVSHSDLQSVLENLNKTASRIFNKPYQNWTEHDSAFVAGYRALRNAQAEGLEAATGTNANDLRKYMAMTYGLEPVAQKAVNRFEGNDRVGLLGEMKKSQGKTGIGHGLLALATGNPGLAAPMILKGAIDVARGHMGKSTSPMRKYLSANVNLLLQKPLNTLSQSELAQLAAAKEAGMWGGEKAGALYDLLQPQEEPTPAPGEDPASAVVAQALPRSAKRKK